MALEVPLITIEGGDGSGKTLHAKHLIDWLMAEKGVPVLSLDYPRYGKHSAQIAERYLNGEFGTANEVAPELASLAYAADRAADKQTTIDFFNANPDGIGVANRYVDSNLAHQGTKISDTDKRRQFYADIRELEYEDLGIPKPILTIALLTPSQIAQVNVDKKAEAMRGYTALKRDIHEADAGHLDKAAANYREICSLYPEDHVAIENTNAEGKLRPVADVQSDIRAAVNAKLFNQPPLF